MRPITFGTLMRHPSHQGEWQVIFQKMNRRRYKP